MARRTTGRIGILSRKRALYATTRLVEASHKAGLKSIVMDTLRCELMLAPRPRMLYRGAEVKGLSVALPRIGASITGYGLKVVSHLGAMGVPVLNDAPSISRSRDKLRCLQLLSAAGIDIPRTVMAYQGTNIRRLVEEVGGLPAIIKLLRGTQGVGVMIASSMAEIQGILSTMWELGQEIMVQEFIRESKGRDVRALVVGDEVVGAMRRTARKGEFRSNLHLGGEGNPLALPKDYAKVAAKAAKVIGLEVAGVDMLEGKKGPKVMELNSSPGFEGLEKATGADIAGAIVAHALAVSRRVPHEGV
jgi:ribosomal protein S6--L-glutamate ligase